MENLHLSDQMIMSLQYDLNPQNIPGEASSIRHPQTQVLAGVCEPVLCSFDDTLSLYCPVEPILFVDQWDDEEEEEEDDVDLDLEEEDEEIWEEEEFDVDEDDFELDEENDLDFDAFEDEEEDYFDEEPEAKGHRVEDRYPAPCNPSYAVEARMELL